VTTVVNLGVVHVGTAADGARSDGDNELGGRHGGIGFQERRPHVLGHRPRHNNAVCMARRSHELDAESAEVENHRVEHVEIRLATVAAAGAYLPELQRPTKKAT